MRGKKALLSSMFILFLVLPAVNIDRIKCMENSGPASENLPEDLTEGEIIKQLCYGNEFSGYGNPGMPEPLALAQVLAGKHIQRETRDRIE